MMNRCEDPFGLQRKRRKVLLHSSDKLGFPIFLWCQRNFVQKTKNAKGQKFHKAACIFKNGGKFYFSDHHHTTLSFSNKKSFWQVWSLWQNSYYLTSTYCKNIKNLLRFVNNRNWCDGSSLSKMGLLLKRLPFFHRQEKSLLRFLPKMKAFWYRNCY